MAKKIKKGGKLMSVKEYSIKREVLLKWLKLLYQISEVEDIKNAITLAKMTVTDGEEIEICNTIAVLYRAECSGEIVPPIGLRQLYKEISSSKSGKIVEQKEDNA